MNVAVLSDAHGNGTALAHAVAWLRPHVDAWLFAGDAFSDHRFSDEVVEVLHELHATYVLGNHELSFLAPSGHRARAAAARADLVAWVDERPRRVEVTLGERRVLMVHASPWEPYDEYLVPGNPRLSRAADLGVDVLVLGHAHVPFAVRVADTLVVNPGSVGRADAPELEGLHTFAVLDTTELALTHYAFAGPGAEITELPTR